MKSFTLFILLLSFQQVFAEAGGDPLFSKLWHLENKGMSVREEVTDIKSILREGVPGEDLGWRSVAKTLKAKFKKVPKVAIVDTGIDYEHEDLAHAILVNEPDCIGGEPPLDEPQEDNDNNGYKGDCKGIDLTTRNKTKKNKPLDDVGHGTHMAGIISAKWNNGVGIVGVHEGIKILPIKAISANESRQRTTLSARVAEAIRYAVSREVDVINLSLGYPIARDTQEMRDAVKLAHDSGVFIVAAAGNNAHSVPVYPCAYSEVICVGSTRNDGKRSLFSNKGAHVDVYAPGETILSTFPTVEIPQFSAVRGYEVKSGTSQASPIVAANLALLKAIHPNESLYQLEQRFFKSLDKQKRLRMDVLFASTEARSDYRIKYKDLSVSRVSDQLEAEIPVEVQPLTSQVRPNIQTQLMTDGYELLGTRYEAGLLKIKVKALNLESPHRVKVKLDVNGQAEFVELTLSRALGQVSDTQNFPIEDSLEIANFNSVSGLDGVSRGLYFAEVTRNKEPRGLKLRLWKRNETGISFVAERVLEGATNDLAIYQADVDGDSVEDLMVLTLSSYRETPESDPSQSMQIHYFDSSLTPKYNETGRIEKLGRPLFNFANFGDHRNATWIYENLDSGEKILVPVVVEAGFVPEPDQNKRQKRAKGSLKAKHLYYLKPKRNEAGALEFESRVVDNAQFRKAIRKKYRMRFYEEINPEFILRDSTQVVVRIGQLERSKYLLLDFVNGEWEQRELNWPRALLGYKTAPVIDESTGKSLTGLFGLISKSRMIMLQLDADDPRIVKEEVIIDLPDESDFIVRPLMFSRDELGLKTVIESGQKLYGFRISNGRVTESFEQELPRTTFFGQLLTQVNAIIRDSVDQPWIYVDDTQINANSVRLQSFDSSYGFRTLLRDSYSLDPRCMPLNPARWSPADAYRIQVLCRVESGLELRSLPMQVNTH